MRTAKIAHSVYVFFRHGRVACKEKLPRLEPVKISSKLVRMSSVLPSNFKLN